MTKVVTLSTAEQDKRPPLSLKNVAAMGTAAVTLYFGLSFMNDKGIFDSEPAKFDGRTINPITGTLDAQLIDSGDPRVQLQTEAPQSGTTLPD